MKEGTDKIGKVDSKDLRARQANRNEASMLDKARSKINNDTTKTGAEKAEQLTNLDALACAEIQCAAGVSANDPQYDAVMKLQNDGEKLKAEQGLNIIDTLSDLGVSTSVEVEETKVTNNFLGTTDTETTQEQQFGYDGVDTINDAITSNEQTVARAQQAGEVVAGTLEVAGAGALCTTGIGCAAGVAVGALGTTTLASGVVGLTSEHEYVNGQKVVDSLSAETHQGDNNPIADVALDATLTAAGGAAGKTIERNADQITDSLGALKDKVVGGKAKVDSNPVDNSMADGDFGYLNQTPKIPSNLNTAINDKVHVIDQDKLDFRTAETFKANAYVTVETKEPVTLYRKFGGGDSQAKIDGGFATTNKNASRQESAVYPKWSTSRFEAEIDIPKGEKLNIGKVAEQPPSSKTPKYRGGGDQILLPRDYPTKWVKSIRDGKTGKVYTIDEFKKEFPDQFRARK